MNKLLPPGTTISSAAPTATTSSSPHQLLDRNELREAGRKLWRRHRLIIAVTAILTLFSILIVFSLTPRYTASVSIMLDPQNTKVANIEAVLGAPSADLEAVYSQAELLTSQQLIGKLVDKADLVSDPEFNASLKPPSFWKNLNPIAFISSLLPPPPGPALSQSEKDVLTRSHVIGAFLKHLSVSPKVRTRVLVLDFQSENPRRAVMLVNMLADLYVVEQLDAKFEATQRVTNWLNDRLSELRQKVKDADRAVETYRANAGLLQSARSSIPGAQGTTLVQQQIADLTTQLTLAKTERVAAEAKLRQLRETMEKPNGEETVAEVLGSTLIQQLRNVESELQRNIADLSTTYGDKHPKLIAARAQLDDVRGKIKQEVAKIAQSLDNAASVARAREQAITLQMDDLKRQVATSNGAEIQLHALEMDAETSRTLLETFMSRFKETSAEQNTGIQTPDTRIISRGGIPEIPSFPKKSLLVSVSFVLALAFAVVVAFIVEYLDRGFRSGVQFEQETGTPVLAMIPAVEETKGRAVDHLVDKPMSSYAEAIRSVYTSLLLTQGSEPIKTIVISSAQPSEGKSTLSVSLARMVALSGHKVLLIEADLRRPSVHNQLGVPRGIGLAEVLVGNATLEDSLYRDPKSTADFLLAGKETLNPSKLLASHQMDELISTVREEYDLVIIDTAPVLAVSDGLLLANKADGVIYSCRWAATTRETSSLGLKELWEANARVIGAVISVVDVKKMRTYGYADTSYYYSSKYRTYYTE